jgi:lipopolysaccharide transport system permease protein
MADSQAKQGAGIREEDFEQIYRAEAMERHYWADLWRFRELFYFLAWRDILVRYKQTVIGILWALIRPFVTMVVFTFVFGKLAKLGSDNMPYPLLVFAAMLPWQFFTNALTESSTSLITNANMLAKIYFPRLVLPTSSVMVAFVDFLIAAAILAGMMFYYGVMPTARCLVLIPLMLLAFAAAMGGGLWFAALNVKYRDFRYIVPFLVQIGFFVSPIGFSSSIVPENLRFLYSLNPMVAVIDGFRWAIAGGTFQFYMPGLIASITMTVVMLISGLFFFRRTEKTFADLI